MKHEDDAHGAGAPVRYRLSCGHVTYVWGQPGASPAKARCHICGELTWLLHVLPKGATS